MKNSVKITLLCVAAVVLVWAVAGAPMLNLETPPAEPVAIVKINAAKPSVAPQAKATEDTQFAHEEKQYND